MAGTTYFVQQCPTCGRNLQIRLQYLGKRVVCQHCGAKFSASDTDSGDFSCSESGSSLLARADQLLLEAASISGVGLGESGSSSRC